MRSRLLGAFALVLLLAGLAPAAPAGAAERYWVDTAHSSVQFSLPYSLMILGEVHGRFRDLFGEATYAPDDLPGSSVRVVIKTASVDTDLEQRDRELRGEDFFAAERYPIITFQSTRIERHGGRHDLAGTLNLRGVEKPLTVPLELAEVGPALVVTGTTQLDRKAFGIGLEAGSGNDLVLGDQVRVSLNLILYPVEGEVAAEVPAATLAADAGRDRAADRGAEAQVELLDGTLTATFAGQDLAALVPLGDGEFRIVGTPPGFRLRFETSEDGEVSAMVLDQGTLGSIRLAPAP